MNCKNDQIRMVDGLPYPLTPCQLCWIGPCKEKVSQLVDCCFCQGSIVVHEQYRNDSFVKLRGTCGSCGAIWHN